MTDSLNGWAVYDMPSEVAPINDLKPHEIGGECWCKPFLHNDVIVHNAMDQREHYEPDTMHQRKLPS